MSYEVVCSTSEPGNNIMKEKTMGVQHKPTSPLIVPIETGKRSSITLGVVKGRHMTTWKWGIHSAKHVLLQERW